MVDIVALQARLTTYARKATRRDELRIKIKYDKWIQFQTVFFFPKQQT